MTRPPARIAGWAVLLLAAVTIPASASHTGSSCSASAAVAVGSVVVPSCSFTLTCPSGASHTCRWTLGVAASGVGYVAGRAFVSGIALPYTFCTGALSCTASSPNLVIGAGQSKTVSCTGGDVALNDAVACTASAT